MHVIRQLHRQHQGALDLPLPHLTRERTFEAECLELRELVAPECLSDLRHDLGAFLCRVLCRGCRRTRSDDGREDQAFHLFSYLT